MSIFDIAVSIDAAPERVFTVLCDVERWPEWTASMTSIHRLDSGPLSVGSKARVLQPKLLPAVWQVTELEDKRQFTWVAQVPGLRMSAAHVIESQGTGSRAVLSLDVSGLLGPFIGRFYGSLIRQYLVTESQGLKRRSEAALP
jgi:uncharacterized protein YndB with AHSA1/START domain